MTVMARRPPETAVLPAPLVLPPEAAAEDAMIVFYSISYDDAGNVIDCDWNFVERGEFDRTYSVIR